MAWPLTGSALTKYNRLLSDLRQYGDFIFVGAPDDITWLQEVIVAASDGQLRPPLDDVANRSHYWMLRTIALLGNQTIMPKPEPCPECPPVIPCPPCPPVPDPRITTTPPGLENEFGSLAFTDISGLTDVVLHGTNIGSGTNIEFQTTLASVSIPDLIVMDLTFVVLNSNHALISFSMPALTTIDNFSSILLYDNTALTSFSLPALATVDNGAYLSVNSNTALTTVSLGSVIFGNGTFLDFAGSALTDTSVNHILARGVASALYVSGTIDTSGGTSAAPTGQGIADKATLIGRGVTVNTN